MKGAEIRRLLEVDPFVFFHYDGVFARDTLINIKKQQHFIVINTGKQNQTGSFHWILIVRSNNTLFYCDPLGAEGNRQHFKLICQNKSLLEGISDLVISENQFQPSNSDNCGLFCVYVAYHIIRKLHQPFNHVLSKIFSDDTAENERRVIAFAQSIGATQ